MSFAVSIFAAHLTMTWNNHDWLRYLLPSCVLRCGSTSIWGGSSPQLCVHPMTNTETNSYCFRNNPLLSFYSPDGQIIPVAENVTERLRDKTLWVKGEATPGCRKFLLSSLVFYISKDLWSACILFFRFLSITFITWVISFLLFVSLFMSSSQ